MSGGERSARDAAHQYAEAAGWPVFPVRPGGKEPAIPSAHPEGDPARGACRGECGRDGHGRHDATTDYARIDRWWRADLARNVGIATGAPGPDVLDIDRHGEASGFPALARLKREGLVGQPQAIIRTPSGGAHLYFKGTEHQGNGHIEAEHVDFRSTGGYVVAPPSQVGGRPYVVVSHQASADTFDWAAAKKMLTPEPERHREWQPSRSDGQSRNLDHLVRYVAECDKGVNDRLYWAACRMAEAGQEDRLPELVRAAYDAGEDRRGQAEKTVQSALQTVRGSRPAEREAAG